MKNINKISTIVLWAAMIVTGVVFGIFYFRISKEQAPDAGSILFWLYMILGICLLSVIGFTVVQVVQKWKDNKRSLLPSLAGLVSILAVLGVSFFLSKYTSRGEEDAWSLVADMSLYCLYILLGLTIVALFAGIVWSYIKRTR